MQPVSPPPGVSLGQPVGDYRLGRLIGQGRLGTVYEATHQQSGQRHAVRLLSPALSRNPQVSSRFPFEARAVSLVNHASICEVREFGLLQDGTAFLVIEYLEGETLAARLQRLGRLEEGQALTVGRHVARGLSAAHTAEVAHGNLCPSNILLVKDPWRPDAERAKVADLGLLRMATGGGDTAALSRSIGTPAYLAPEQRVGLGAGLPVDVFALGAILYEMIVGRPPFPGASIEEVDAGQARGAPPSLREVDPMIPAEMVKLVEQMLARAPMERPQMQQVAEGLDRMDAHKATRAYTAVSLSDGPPAGPQAPGRGTMAWAQVVLQQRQEKKRQDKDTPGRRQAEDGRGPNRRALLAVMGVSIVAAFGGAVAYVVRRSSAEDLRPPQKPPEKPAEKPPEKPPEKPAEKPPEKPPEAPPEPPEEEPVGKKGKKRRGKKKEKKKKEKKRKRKR